MQETIDHSVTSIFTADVATALEILLLMTPVGWNNLMWAFFLPAHTRISFRVIELTETAAWILP